jgi:hypothetical protein
MKEKMSSIKTLFHLVGFLDCRGEPELYLFDFRRINIYFLFCRTNSVRDLIFCLISYVVNYGRVGKYNMRKSKRYRRHSAWNYEGMDSRLLSSWRFSHHRIRDCGLHRRMWWRKFYSRGISFERRSLRGLPMAVRMSAVLYRRSWILLGRTVSPMPSTAPSG